MEIEKWVDYDEQKITLGNHTWSIARLVEMSRELPVIEVPIDALMVNYSYGDIRLRDMVMHMNAVNEADLSYPIILDEDGELMDGRHRIMKAMLVGAKTIKMVRFDKNPDPCAKK